MEPIELDRLGQRPVQHYAKDDRLLVRSRTKRNVWIDNPRGIRWPVIVIIFVFWCDELVMTWPIIANRQIVIGSSRRWKARAFEFATFLLVSSLLFSSSNVWTTFRTWDGSPPLPSCILKSWLSLILFSNMYHCLRFLVTTLHTSRVRLPCQHLWKSSRVLRRTLSSSSAYGRTWRTSSRRNYNSCSKFTTSSSVLVVSSCSLL